MNFYDKNDDNKTQSETFSDSQRYVLPYENAVNFGDFRLGDGQFASQVINDTMHVHKSRLVQLFRPEKNASSSH